MNIISLFSGVGGMDLAFKQAGFNIIWANDSNKAIEETYRYNNQDTTLDMRDIVDIDAKKIPGKRKGVAGVIGSPPAQNFSTGKLSLSKEFMDVIRVKYPKFFVIEMPVLNRTKPGLYKLESILEQVKKIGYRVNWKIINANEYGVPQDRKRLFIIGYSVENEKTFDFDKLKKTTKRTLEDAIGDMPYNIGDNTKNNNEYIKFKSDKTVFPRNPKRNWTEASLTIVSDLRNIPMHPESGEVERNQQNKWVIKNFKEGSHRRLSIRECARIQTFPDEFEFFYKNLNQGYRMVANATPVKLMKLIADVIKEDLYGEKLQTLILEEDEEETIKKIHNNMLESRKQYGSLKKCELHLHTPASYDYRLKIDEKYEDITIEELLDVSLENEYLTSENVNEIKRNIDEYSGEEYKDRLRKKEKPFVDFKEYLAYMNIAHKLYMENVEVVVISDHNTIKGYTKLKDALHEYYKKNVGNKEYVNLFLGVEISCSDKNHVVAIFDNDKIEELEIYLEKIILSEKDGSYLDSRKIMEEVAENGGMAYLAHVNTSDLLGNNAYKTKLFNSKELKGIGINEASKKTVQIERIKDYNKNIENQKPFLTEGDSHEIETIGTNNTWIKFNKVNYTALKKAFVNFNVCIYDQKPDLSKKFIKGLVIYPGKEGFLNSNPEKKEEYLNIEFSRDLNCIIGGRGSGKSTLLNIVQTIFSYDIEDDRVLEFISKHEKIYCGFYIDGEDYILKFIPQTRSKDEKYYSADNYLPDAVVEEGRRKRFSDAWITLYKINSNDILKLNATDTKYILGKIFRRNYNINQIINKVERGETGEFIRNVVTYGLNYDDLESYILEMRKTKDGKLSEYLSNNIGEIIQKLEKRKSCVENVIQKFNESYKPNVQIIYSPKEKEHHVYLNDFFEGMRKSGNIINTHLRWSDIQDCIYKTIKKIGFLKLVSLIVKKRYNEIEKYWEIKGFSGTEELTFRDVEKNLKKIDDENIKLVYDEIFNHLLSQEYKLTTSIEECLKVIDDFTITFNVNSKESVKNERVIMKNIEDLSLGQKVVAILTFVFNFGLIVNDNTPLIIDQPEDNLDNRYIFGNLVKSLNRIKNNRQVIIATHNSTVVTNASAEQIIVMSSDNITGWVEKSGYTSDKTITKHIINNLEGGIDSFKNKMDNYSLMIDEL